MTFNYVIEENKSSYHKKIISFFKKEYPLFDMIQEFTINMDNQTLFCDIVCKSPIKFIIEINPLHHYQFVPYFHKTYEGFKQAQRRDSLKEKWAEMNDYMFIVLKEEDFKKDKFQEKIKEILG